jgi:hypothetical protein
VKDTLDFLFARRQKETKNAQIKKAAQAAYVICIFKTWKNI